MVHVILSCGRYESQGVWYESCIAWRPDASGVARDFLCQGTRDQVMRILVSIYGWTPSKGFRLIIHEE